MLNWRCSSGVVGVSLSALLFAPGCSGTSLAQIFSTSAEDQAGFVQVDELLDRVEDVHVGCELAGRNVRESLAALMALVGSDFRGNPELVYDDYLVAIALSETQAKELRESYEPMVDVSAQVFESWEADLEAFSSETLRAHSRDRMESARARYDAIVALAEPALDEYESFNRALRDYALYLGNDLSTGAVAAIEGELRDLANVGSKLEENFETCTAACRDYVRRAALRGQISPKSKHKPGV